MTVPLPPSIPFKDPAAALTLFENHPLWQILGKSAANRPIYGRHLAAKSGVKKILFIGGVHGNETEGVAFALDFCKEFGFQENNSLPYELFLIPLINPDGFIDFKRQNGNGVDLNRNLPSKDWSKEYQEIKYFPGLSANSESENQLLVQIITDFQPDFILSLHSWKPMVNINGPAEKIAQAFYDALPPHERMGETMIIANDIGYPTPGSLGTYAGWERHIPTITLEFCRGDQLEGIYSRFRDPILAAFAAVGK